VDQYRRFAFQPPYRLRHRVTWRNTQTHVDMIRPCMALHQFYAKLLA
jgi:thymidylate synthase